MKSRAQLRAKICLLPPRVPFLIFRSAPILILRWCIIQPQSESLPSPGIKRQKKGRGLGRGKSEGRGTGAHALPTDFCLGRGSSPGTSAAERRACSVARKMEPIPCQNPAQPCHKENSQPFWSAPAVSCLRTATPRKQFTSWRRPRPRPCPGRASRACPGGGGRRGRDAGCGRRRPRGGRGGRTWRSR